MAVPILGLAGYAQSGKDTAARALVDAGWERRAFADKLREFLLALDPIASTSGIRVRDLVTAYGWDKVKTTVPEVRELLQRCGTEAGRQVLGENVWVDATLRDLGPAPVVVTDVRYPNEMQAIRDRGGYVLRVERWVEPPRMADGTVHPSETALDGMAFDGVLDNNGTIEELHHATLRWERYVSRLAV